jgi:predicted N-acyltransferase
MNLFEKYIDSNKEEILLRLFTCGNNLVSGEYGFLFNARVPHADANLLLLEISDLISKEEKLSGTISAILLKDFREPLLPKKIFKDRKYSDFFVEPNLVVEIPAGVNTLEKYLELFSKKYRNRAKGIFKDLQGVQTRYLELEEITKAEKQIFRLYENVFEKAKFKLIKLPGHYFSAVKKIFKAQFIFKGFYYESKMIGFASCFVKTDGNLEAHYIGIDYEVNNRFNLYQNILYTMIEEGITHQCTKVNLGRTAAEIKTTVGAKPQELLCYMKPQNTISKLIQKPFISFLQPAAWTARNPFKEGAAEKGASTAAQPTASIPGRT